MINPLIVSIVLEVEVNEYQWARSFGAGDAYDHADAQQRRSLVADVEDYVLNQITGSAAATEDEAIVGVDIAREGTR